MGLYEEIVKLCREGRRSAMASIVNVRGAYRPVNQVTIVKDRETGQPRGFAFVEMAVVARCRQGNAGLNGTSHTNINEPRPKPQREDGREWR